MVVSFYWKGARIAGKPTVFPVLPPRENICFPDPFLNRGSATSQNNKNPNGFLLFLVAEPRFARESAGYEPTEILLLYSAILGTLL